jgi:flagellar motor switch protein FliN/FliY
MGHREKLIELFIENWSSVFFAIIGKEVKIVSKSVDKVEGEEIKQKLSAFKSFITLDYEGDINGQIIAGSSNMLISIISNLMIGLDSYKEEINEDDIDAFNEAINQMFASCVVPLSEKFDIDVKFKNIQFVEKFETLEEKILQKSEYWQFEIEISDVSTETFCMIVPEDFAKPGETAVDPGSNANQVRIPATEPQRQFENVNYGNSNIEILLDVELPVVIRIGSTEMKLIDIMSLGIGSMIELNKLVDDPVEVLVNNKLIARGEVVVYDGNFAIRVLEVKSREERIKSLA